MIVTVTLNPALHVRYQADQVAVGQANEVSRVSYRPGGRGLAVARVLHTFGHEVVAAGLVGGASGEVIRAELAQAGVATQFTRISGESRRVLEVADKGDGQVTTFFEPAPYITTEELGRLAADYRSLMADADAVVICGSLPDGLPAETYGSLASYAADAGVPVVLSASGGALWHGARRGPALVMPESAEHDFAELIDKGAGALATRSGPAVRVITAQAKWQASLADWHSAGAGAEPGGREASPSRDALVAGLVPGIALGWSWPDMLRHAVALAAAVGASGDVDLDAYEALVPKVVIEPREERPNDRTGE
ncbi:MAG TPA: PfkB family carbohydrate kinase [Streptosporangiaceae bacterium]|nr:PfkB family carbohydrate kinase [Streptosporangiaceae bacterium]